MIITNAEKFLLNVHGNLQTVNSKQSISHSKPRSFHVLKSRSAVYQNVLCLQKGNAGFSAFWLTARTKEITSFNKLNLVLNLLSSGCFTLLYFI